METGHAPWWPCFLTDQIYFSYLARRSPSDYFYQIILNSDKWFQNRRSSKFLSPRWRPCFLTDQISFGFFCRGSPREHSCEVWLKLAEWYRKSCHLKEIVDDG